MKKIISLLFCGLLIFTLSSRNSHAKIEPINFYISGGVETNLDAFFDPVYWVEGISLDINFSSLPLMISPECHIMVRNFRFDYFRLVPAILVNFKLSSLFVGVGITK